MTQKNDNTTGHPHMLRRYLGPNAVTIQQKLSWMGQWNDGAQNDRIRTYIAQWCPLREGSLHTGTMRM